jgi:hypothetical protein
MSATMAWEDELRSWLEPFLKSYQDLMILAYIEVRWFALVQNTPMPPGLGS